jgi:hypothetical protein
MKQSLTRRIAVLLSGYAARILPHTREPWAEAMRHEIANIDSDWGALTWAAGCVLASCVERSGVGALLGTWYVRALLVALILTQVASFLFATVLTVAYRGHHLGMAAFLGGFTPGDDYRRFLPLMERPSWGLHALWVGASVLFLAAAVQLLRRQVTAFALFAAAWALGTVGNLIAESSPVYRQVFSFPQPAPMRDYVIPAASALLPLAIAVALWAHGRYVPAQEG